MTVAVLVSSLKEGSETFIKQHIQLLGKETKVFHGGLTPFLDAADENKLDATLGEKLAFRILNFLRKESNIRTYLLKKLIRKEHIHCCYVEFGPVGVGALARTALPSNIGAMISADIVAAFCFSGTGE